MTAVGSGAASPETNYFRSDAGVFHSTGPLPDNLELPEALGLGGHALCYFLHIAGDVGELDAEAADLVGELIDQPVATQCHLLFSSRHGHSYI